jgi:dUTP pyrophosphatase
MSDYRTVELFPMSLIVQPVHHCARLPVYATSGSAALDLFACEAIVIPPHSIGIVQTGVKMAIPPGMFGSVRCRSSLALRNISVEAGVIDSDYRGEIKVILRNHSGTPFHVPGGHGAKAIAQLIIQPYVQAELIQGQVENDTERGHGGFGSTSS